MSCSPQPLGKGTLGVCSLHRFCPSKRTQQGERAARLKEIQMKKRICFITIVVFAVLLCGCSEVLEYPTDGVAKIPSLSVLSKHPCNVVKCYHNIENGDLFLIVQANLSLDEISALFVSGGWQRRFVTKEACSLEREQPNTRERLLIAKSKDGNYEMTYRQSAASSMARRRRKMGTTK